MSASFYANKIHHLRDTVKQLEQSLAHAQERERSLTEKMGELGAREATSSEQVRSERERRMETEARLAEAEERLRSEEDRRGKERQTMGEEITEAKREKEFLTASLGTEKAESEGRRRKCLALMEQLKERDRRVKELQAELETRSRQEAGGRSSVTSLRSVSASPTPSHVSDTSWMPGTESEVIIRDDFQHGLQHFLVRHSSALPPRHFMMSQDSAATTRR